MLKHKIAIVNSSSFGKIFPKHMDRLKALGEVDYFRFEQTVPGKELAAALDGYDMIIASVTPFFSREFFDYKDDLKLISRHGIGYNNVDLAAAKAHGTIVALVPALVERDAVAGNNITNLLNVMRKTSQAQQRVKEDKWEDRAQFIGHTLYNKIVGVIGLGNTGSCVAETVRNGFRCRVLAYDPYRSRAEIEQFGAEKVDFNTVLTQSDVLCLCANLTEENYHFIGKAEVAKMKNNVYISNSARGALISEEAIVEGLSSGKIAGFATDVLEVEPGRSDHPYLAFDNVVVTPHTSAYTMECLEAMGEKCVEDCENVSLRKLPVRSVQAESSWIKGGG